MNDPRVTTHPNIVYNVLEREIAILREEKMKAEEECKRLQSRNRELSRVIRMLQAELTTGPSEESQQALNIVQNLCDVETIMSKRDSEIRKLKQENRDLRALLNTNSSKQATTAESAAEIRSTIASLRSDLASLKSEIASFRFDREKVIPPIERRGQDTLAYMRSTLIQFFAQDTAGRMDLIPLLLTLVGCSRQQIWAAQRQWARSTVSDIGKLFT